MRNEPPAQVSVDIIRNDSFNLMIHRIGGAGIMGKTSTSGAKCKKNRPKAKLGIPDLEHSKAAVFRSLGSPDSRRGYQHAIDEFVAWYCSEPRLAFNKTVILRYRFHLEERGLAPGTINVRLAAVRRLAYEAADAGV